MSEAKSNKESEKTMASLTAPVSTIPSNTNLMLLSNTKDFDTILKEAGDRILVIEFFATWCGPCKILGGKLKELAHNYKGKILIIKIDVDDFEEIALEHNVSAMPTLMIMKNQKKLEQFSSSNIEVLQKNLDKYAGKLDTNQDMIVDGTTEAFETQNKPSEKSE